MLNELKILFGNIRNNRKVVLSEGVSMGSMVDAVNQHKILLIYYNGEETHYKGWRTIKPFVVGKHEKTGSEVVRAWQDAGSSDGFKGVGRTPRMDHEKHADHKGRIKPGWRLFKLDDISSMLPKGRFQPDEVINRSGGAKYNPNDSDMSSIDAAIQIGADRVDQEKEKEQFNNFYNAPSQSRQPTKDEIDHLWSLASRYYKKSRKKMWVIQNGDGDFILRGEKGAAKFPEGSVVGNLDDLHKKYFRTGPAPIGFFDQNRRDALNKKPTN